MLQDFDFDFSGFEDVPPPQPRATYRLTFTEEAGSARTIPFTASFREPAPFACSSALTAALFASILRDPTI